MASGSARGVVMGRTTSHQVLKRPRLQVMDGHGGCDAAESCRVNLLQAICRRLESSTAICSNASGWPDDVRKCHHTKDRARKPRARATFNVVHGQVTRSTSMSQRLKKRPEDETIALLIPRSMMSSYRALRSWMRIYRRSWRVTFRTPAPPISRQRQLSTVAAAECLQNRAIQSACGLAPQDDGTTATVVLVKTSPTGAIAPRRLIDLHIMLVRCVLLVAARLTL